MSTVSKQEIDEVVKKYRERLLPKEGYCQATPAAMAMVVAELDDLTKSIIKESQSSGLIVDTNVAQWATDLATWQQRLAAYKSILADTLEKTASAKGSKTALCESIFKSVTSPLLDGYWYTNAPGIVFNQQELTRMKAGIGRPTLDSAVKINGSPTPDGASNPKPADIITPFTLGNQLATWQDHQSDRFYSFFSDLDQALIDIVKAGGDAAAEAYKSLTGKGLFDDAFSSVRDAAIKVAKVAAAVGVAGLGIFLVWKIAKRSNLMNRSTEQTALPSSSRSRKMLAERA